MIAGLVQNARFVINNIPVQLLPPPLLGSRIEVTSHGTLLQGRVCPCIMPSNTNHNCHYRGELLFSWSGLSIFPSRCLLDSRSCGKMGLNQYSLLLKCLWNEMFYYLIRKSLQNDEQWRLFYCDSTLGCWVIQDFDLCKLDDLWRHRVDTKWCKITKYWISLQVLSLQSWNFAGLMYCNNYTFW